MMRVLIAAILISVLTLPALADRRVALVFAADKYKTIRPLQNAGKDGVAVKAALEALDFEVFLETDRDLRRMRRALDDFREDAKDADVAVVFFAGHGVEIAGENRLLPVDADASSLSALKASSLPLEEVREAVADVGKIGLILLDACRNDPFGASSGDGRGAVGLVQDGKTAVVPGLGRVGRAENILFAFSAAPGKTASDGNGENSPFTTALAKYLGTDGLEIRSVLTLVQQDVYDLTGGSQLPYVENGLPKLFFAADAPGELPERERLLLAMADITPSIRDEIERIAVERNMPLAPLYGALISSGAAGLSKEDREKKLAEAADAFVKVRDELRMFASDDPRVTGLRQDAEQQLSLGAFDSARSRLAEAADIDAQSRQVLKENLVGRTLSEAATRYLSGGAARADLRYALAIADYEKAAKLFLEVDGEDIPANDRLQQILTLQALGDIHITVGNTAKASLAFGEMLRVTTRRAASDPGNAEWQNDLSVSYDRFGDMLAAEGDRTGALNAYRDSLTIAKRLAASDPGNAKWQRDLSLSYESVGDMLASEGDRTGALEAYRDGLAMRERLAASDTGNAVWTRDLSVSYDKIGDILAAGGDRTGAMKAYRDSLTIAERLTASDPGNAEWQSDLSVSYDRVGDMLAAGGDRTGALKAYRDSLAVRRRLAASDPGNAKWQRDLSVSYDRVGDMLAAEGDRSGALKAYRDSLAIAERLAASDPRKAEWQRDLSVLYDKVGNMLAAEGDRTGAVKAFHDSLTISQRLSASDPGNAEWQRDLSVSYDKVGDMLAAEGDRTGALKAYRDSLAIAERLAASDPANAEWQRDLSLSYDNVGYMLAAEGDPTGALKAYRDSLAIRGRLAVSDPGNAEWQQDLSVSYNNIGDMLAAEGDRTGALKVYRDSLVIRERLAASDPGNAKWQRDLFVSHAKIGFQLNAQGKTEEARAAFEAGRTIIAALLQRFPDTPQWTQDLASLEGQLAALPH